MKTKNLLLGLLFGLFWQTGFGQTDTAFWFVAPEAEQAHGDRPIYLRLTSLMNEADVVISMPAEPAFSPIQITMAPNSSQSIDLTPFIDLVENKPGGIVLNKGIYIRSTSEISAYYEIFTSCHCNPEIFSLKGRNAIGNSFFTPFQTQYNRSAGYHAAINIVSTEDNNQITIIPSVDLFDHPAGIPFTITLNKGQTIALQALGINGTDNPMGTKITSTKPVAVTVSEDTVGGPGGCGDMLGDQIVPVNLIGGKYIVPKGFLNFGEYVYFLAVENSTDIFIEGNTVAVASLQSGEFYQYPVDHPVFVESSKPIYVYHVTGYGCELGSALIPSFECTGSTQIGFTRSTDEYFSLYLMLRSGSEGDFLINGNSSLVSANQFSPVSGTNGEWVYANIEFNTSEIPVEVGQLIANSSDLFHMGIINGGSVTGCRYGYFSNFNSLELGSDLTVCAGDTAILDAGFGMEPYLWSTGATTRTIEVTNPGTYWVQAGNGSCLLSDTIYVSFQSLPVVNLGSDTLLPCGVLSGTLSTLSGYASYQWSVPGDSNQLEVTSSGTYWCRVTDSLGCSAADTVSVTIRPLPANLSNCAGNVNLTDGLVAYYPFNGNANDESGNGYHGMVNGAILSEDRNGFANKAFSFNGFDNWIEVPAISIEMPGVSAAAWIYCSDILPPGSPQIIGIYPGLHHVLQLETNQLLTMFFNSTPTYATESAPGTVVPLEWSFVCGTYDGNYERIYFNGNLVAETPKNDSYSVVNKLLSIGRQNDPIDSYWRGKIDDIRIYNRALTPEEVLCLYQGDCNPLAAYLTSDTLCRGSLAQLNLLNPQAGIGYALQVDSVDVTPLIFSTSDTLSLLTPALWQNASLTVRAVDTATGCEITLDSVWAVTIVAPEAVVTTGVSVCPGDTATLIVTGGASYLWSNGSTNDTITVAPVVATTYYAIAYSEMGCSDTAFTTVTVLPLPVVQAQSNSPVCEGDSLLLNASGAATYTWTGPGFSSNSANTSVFPTTVASTGWYYATGTSQQGCTQTDSVWAEVLTAFNIAQQIGICQGESYTLPGGTIVNTAGTYIDTLSSTFGCDSIITTQLTIKPLPLIAIAGSSPMCQDETLMVSAAGGASYQWTGPANFTANTATATIPNAQPANTGYYTVAVTGQNGCTAWDSVYVKVLPPDYREENIGICQGESYTLPNGITTYTSGTWLDTLTNIFGCDSIIATNVVVNPNPVAIAQSNAPVCEGSPLQFTLNGGEAYHWSGPNNWISSEQSPEIAHPMPYQSGWYYATLINEYQCDDTDSLFVLINAQSLIVVKDSLCQGSSYQLPGGSIVNTPGIYTDTLASPVTQCDSIVLTWLTLKPQPQVSLVSNSPVCIGSDVMVLVNGGIEWQWTGPNGFASDQPEAMVPMATAADSGWYYLHTTGDNGCTRTDSLLVDVHDCTGIGEWPDGLTVKVMPNPFDEKIVVNIEASLPIKLGFALHGANGKMVKYVQSNLESGSSTVEIHTGDLSAGFYLLKISEQDTYRVFHLLKAE
ncbi:MAG: T9SS type A sorting domain-containing protein [Bacteroidales bacterium]|nr:T9SS type A sorting domain-containing protein [Bacteroidales bacterium]